MSPRADHHAMNEPQTPIELREGVRDGIVASIRNDVELRGGRTARMLVAAGLVGAAGAAGATLLVADHPFGHHPPWHLAAFSALWAGLLIVSLALIFLQVRTHSLPLAHAASVGVLGLGIAGLCGALCPNPHFLHWWLATGTGARLAQTGGEGCSALCFGMASTLFVGAASALLMWGGRRRETSPLLAAAMLVVLLAPGVILQSVGTSLAVFGGWMAGTAGGAYLGVAGGLLVRRVLRSG